MVPTGITGLDQRLGGIQPGRYFLLTGTPGSGKTSACLHYLADGLQRGEPGVILTQENPEDLFAQAQFIGLDLEHAVAHDQLAVLQYRLDFSTNYARVGSPKVVAREFIDMLEGIGAKRLVVDSILPFVQAGGMTHGAISALLQVMEELQPTSFFTVPGDLSDSFYARLYDPLVSNAAGILHFEIRDDLRQISVRKIRHAPLSTEPLRFVIRAGVGIMEVNDMGAPVAEPTESRRVALADAGTSIDESLVAALAAASYDTIRVDTASGADALAKDHFGVVLVAVDALDPAAPLQYVRQVRSAGVQTPIVLVAAGSGLRAGDRARGLRAGADDFLTTDVAPNELVERIEALRVRGPRATVDRLRPETLLLQPRTSDGEAIPVDRDEIARAARLHQQHRTTPFFALVEMRATEGHQKALFDALVARLRLENGDLVAAGENGEIFLFLQEISRRHARELLERVFDSDPRIKPREQPQILHFPSDAERIHAWLGATPAAEPVRAHG